MTQDEDPTGENGVIPKELEFFRSLFEEAIRERAGALGIKFDERNSTEDILFQLETVTKEQVRSLPKPQFMIVAAPTAVGKTTVGEKLEAMGIRRFPRYTTRPLREGEVDGRDYLFTTMEELQKRRDHGELIQYSETYGEGRGMNRQLFLDYVAKGLFYIDGSTRTPVDFREHSEEDIRLIPFITIELLPPSFDEWMRRMINSRPLEDAMKRLPTAIEHIKGGRETVDLVLINDDVDRVVGSIKDVV